MDQRRGHIAEDVSDIVRTRNAISDKLELLERRIEETVQGAKLSAGELVDRARDAADEFLDKTKQTFDPTYQVHQHPWLMVGGAIAVGYVLGLLESRAAGQSRSRGGVYPYYPPSAETPGAPIASGGVPSGMSNVWESVSRELSAEVDHAKQALIEAGRSFIHEFFQQLIPAVGTALGLGRPSDRAASGNARDQRRYGEDTHLG